MKPDVLAYSFMDVNHVEFLCEINKMHYLSYGVRAKQICDLSMIGLVNNGLSPD